MRIAFRVDASLEIGTGHVMRCLTLARALRDVGANCSFVTRCLSEDAAVRIRREDFSLTVLPRPVGEAVCGPPAHAAWAGVDWARDAAETIEAIERYAPEWLVVDHYAFDSRWERAVCSAETRLLVIDDLADRQHHCHMLVDQNFGRLPQHYDGLVPWFCERLVGVRFAMLRAEFAEMRKTALEDRQKRLHAGVRRILVTLGGTDPVDATSQVLLALRDFSMPSLEFMDVVMGSGAPGLRRVRTLAREMPWPTEVVVDAMDMAVRMASSDLAIGAAGATTWERCSVGLPTIMIPIAANQSVMAAALTASGAVLCPGSLSAPGFGSSLRYALASAHSGEQLKRLARVSAEICDAHGVNRVVECMLGFRDRFGDANEFN